MGQYMSMIRQIITRWTTPSGSGKATVMYFEGSPTISTQRSNLNTFWTSVMGALDNSTSYTIDTSGIELESTTGALVGSWTHSTPYTDSGDQSTEPVADATMALIRWKTSTIVGGRFLTGRTFIPGLDRAQLTNGNLSSSTVAALNGFAATFIAAPNAFGIWHRPIAGSGGTHVVVSAADTWSELAVLRRRRG